MTARMMRLRAGARAVRRRAAPGPLADTDDVRIAGVGKAFPPHYYDQEALLAGFIRHWSRRHPHFDRLESLHRRVLVGGRYLALPMEEYEQIATWGQANDAWIRVAQEVGERAVADALDCAGLTVADVGALIFVTVTGVATPSIDARLINRMGLPADVTRVPVFGLGCVAGAAGLARAADYVRAYPGRVAVLLSVELCSLTLQQADDSIANLIATGLFGDGAAAVVVTGDGRRTRPLMADTAGARARTTRASRGVAPVRPGPRIVASRSVFYPDSERVMGWDISESGFRVVLSADVPLMVIRNVRRDIDAFLASHGLDRDDIDCWITHPGGPKVLEAMQEALELPREALALSWKSLGEVGNLSSTSVLLVLKETLESRPPAPGRHGLMIAMGPGFCSELVLLRF
jgi:alkylresorcinol/alkylpyrone synthase